MFLAPSRTRTDIRSAPGCQSYWPQEVDNARFIDENVEDLVNAVMERMYAIRTFQVLVDNYWQPTNPRSRGSAVRVRMIALKAFSSPATLRA